MGLFQVTVEHSATFYVDANNAKEAQACVRDWDDLFDESELFVYADEVSKMPTRKNEQIFVYDDTTFDWLNPTEYLKWLDERRKVVESNKPLQREQIPGLEAF